MDTAKICLQIVYSHVLVEFIFSISSCLSHFTRPNIVDSEDDDDDNEGEEWVFPVPEKKSEFCFVVISVGTRGCAEHIIKNFLILKDMLTYSP